MYGRDVVPAVSATNTRTFGLGDFVERNKRGTRVVLSVLPQRFKLALMVFALFGEQSHPQHGEAAVAPGH